MDVLIDGIIYQGQPHGGIVRLYNEILPRMCKMSDSLQVTLVTSGRCVQPLPAHARIRHISVLPIERFLRPGRLWGWVAPRMRAFAQRLHLGGETEGIWHSTYYTMPMGWKGPRVITAVDMIHEHLPNLFGADGREIRRQKDRCLGAADAIIAISRTTAEDLQQFYGIEKDRIWMIPLACSDTFLQSDGLQSGPTRRKGRPFLLYVGIRSKYKNTDLMIKAYSQWRHRREVDLIVVGRPWSSEEIRELAALNIEDRVHLLGYVDDQKLVDLYRRAAAFVYPSLYEGFGVPVLEAMACGCPVIGSRIPSTIEIAEECPIYFDPVDMDALVVAFEVALSEGRNSERVRHGLDRVRQYSWDRTARETLDVYKAVS